MTILKPARPAAHSPRPGTDQWEDLACHLAAVAKCASVFANSFGLKELAFLVGILHDLGKQNPDWQDYLVASHASNVGRGPRPRTKVPHAIWGAAFAYRLRSKLPGDIWQDLALPIQAHHSAILDAGDAALRFEQFAADHPNAFDLMRTALADAIAAVGEPLPVLRGFDSNPAGRDLMIRMLLSALVDADRLASEKHSNPEKSTRRGNWPTPKEFLDKLLVSKPPASDQSPDVKRVRDEVFDSCLAAACKPPGLFRLTAPTGSGKTRSSLAFALKHAAEHDLRGVIFALPYTSIVEQTVQAYRGFLGDDVVLEHHSALEVSDTEGEDERAVRFRLATENWDAPVVVTTTVQLFESLFANRPSKVRKLHRLAKSVIVLDEIQAFPPELLRPTVDVLRLLATPVERGGYGATVVLSTATQPTFEVGPLAALLRDTPPTEIVPTHAEHYEALRRVTFDWRPTPISWSDLADELRPRAQVMVVLNTRKDALALVDAIGEDESVFHLSTLLCGAHRRAVLRQVKERLTYGQPVKLISTQVVECGVDLDFPVVYRALGPLDRIVQAAGRCNRRGLRSEGQVVVFVPAEGGAPAGPYKTGLEKALLLLKTRDIEELHRPQLFRDYFQKLLASVDLDKRKIQDNRQVLDFPQVAHDYRLIDATVPVVVRYGDDWQARLDEWTSAPSRESWRRLQPYLVNLFERDVERDREWLAPIGERLYFWMGSYDAERHRGIIADFADPSDLVTKE